MDSSESKRESRESNVLRLYIYCTRVVADVSTLVESV